MDHDQIEIITVNDRISAEIEEPRGAAVGEALNGPDGSEEADSGSQHQSLNYTSVAQEVQEESKNINVTECEIRVLAEARGLEPSKGNLWNLVYEKFNKRRKSAKKSSYKRKEEIRSVKNEIYQVVGFFRFFDAFQGLLITAAAQSNLLRCNNVGYILALSAFATAVAVFGIVQKNAAMDQLRFAKRRNKHRMEVSPYNIFFLVVVASIQQ
ncbi:unnamed protein product [Sphagnum jensenii]|uniref:Uncharacterized protein n=1 Tax=Sphagnum jensenii TaxID=128206 RepID=A0ABP1ALR3_9BRYO